MALNKFIVALFILLLIVPLAAAETPYKYTYKNHKATSTHTEVTFPTLKTDKTQISINSLIDLERHKAEINSKLYPEFRSVPAEILFKNSNLINPIVLHNGKWDKTIKLVRDGLTSWKIQVKGFSSYELIDTDWNGVHDGTTVRNGFLEKDSDLKLYLPFRYENKSENITDESLEENIVTIRNGTQWDPINPLHYSYDADTPDSEITTPMVPDLNFSFDDSEFTLEMWVLFEEIKAYQWLFSNTNLPTFGDKRAGVIVYANWDDLKFRISNTTANSDSQGVTATNILNENKTWVHIAATLNETTGTLYYNGEDAGSFARDRNPHAEGVWEFGSGGSTSADFTGKFDEVKIYNNTLDSEDILILFENKTHPSVAPILHYAFRQDDFMDVADETGNGHLGTFAGGGFSEQGGINSSVGSHLLHTNQSIYVEGSTELDLAGNMSAGIWVYSEEALFEGKKIMTKSSTGLASTANTQFALGVDQALQLEYEHMYDTATSFNFTGSAISIGSWNHIFFTRNNATRNVTLYINGEPAGSAIYSTVQYPNDGQQTDLYIAEDPKQTPHTYYNITVSLPQVFDRVLNITEIVDMYNQSPPYLYKSYATYMDTLNSSDYDPTIEQNVWHNFSLHEVTGSCAMLSSVEYNTLPSVQLGTCLWNLSDTQGEKINISLSLDGEKSTTPTFHNWTFFNNKYLSPHAGNMSISGGENTSRDITGNVTFYLNDTDLGSIIIMWFVDSVNVENDTTTGLSNGSIAFGTLASTNFVKDNDVYFRALPSNPPVIGEYNQSQSIVIGNAGFDIIDSSPSANVTLIRPNTYSFTVTLNDVDNDVVTMWSVDGINISNNTNSFTFNSGDYSVGSHEIIASSSDGEFSDSATWSVESTQVDNSLAMVLGISFMSLFFLFFAFRLDDKHFLLKILCIFFALYCLILIPSLFLNGVDGVKDIFLNVPLWFFRIFIIYFSLYLFYHWVQKSEKFVGVLKKLGLKKK